MRRNGHADRRREAVQPEAADWEPPPGVQQITGVVTDIGELEAGNRAVIPAFELPFVLERQSGGRVLGKPGWQGYADRGILGNALGGERLVLFVENLGDPQVVVQLEDRDAQVLQGGKFDLGAGRDRMQMRRQFSLDLIVVHAQTGFLGRPGRDREPKQQQDSQGTG